MKRFFCLSVFAALALAGTAAYAADECTKITATGHPQYPVIAYRQGDNIVGWTRNSWEAGPTRNRRRSTARPT